MSGGANFAAAISSFSRPSAYLTSLTIGRADPLVLVVLGGVDVDVDDRRLRRELVRVARDPVVEAGAQDEQQVALVDRPVAVGGAVHAEPLHRERAASPGTPPRPMSVVATGMLVFSANARSSRWASAEMMPPPA